MKSERWKSGRGGAREGAGRPEAENPKIKVSYRLAPDVVEWLRAQPNQAAAIERAVRAEIMGAEIEAAVDDIHAEAEKIAAGGETARFEIERILVGGTPIKMKLSRK